LSVSISAAEEPDAIESFWRSLRFFSIYRLSIALLFLVAALVFGDTISLGTQDARLFDRVAAVYLLLAIAFLVALLRRPRHFNLQLSVQVAVDIAALTLMMFASGGQKSGIAILLLVVVAGAALVGQGRMTLFYAARRSLPGCWRRRSLRTRRWRGSAGGNSTTSYASASGSSATWRMACWWLMARGGCVCSTRVPRHCWM
jgi:hypothetical protein